MSAGTTTTTRAGRRWAMLATGTLLGTTAAVLPPAASPALAVPRAVTARHPGTPATASGSAGGAHSCAVENGKAYCWGGNTDGQLGNGGAQNASVPVAVDTSGVLAGKTLAQVSAGGHFTCALDTAGAAYCWGAGYYGALGNGGTVSSAAPARVDTSGVLAGKTLTQISAGLYSVCALDTAGAAYCWGANFSGQLGNGTTTSSPVPVRVDTSGALAGKTLAQITAGATLTCALDTGGTAYCWGGNSDGQLGNGTTTSSPVPVRVDTSGALAGKTLAQVSAGGYFACALDTAGAAYCWGSDDQGQIGNGSSGVNPSTPAEVYTGEALAGKTLTQISAGGSGACALAAAAAYCWGSGVEGQLGDGRGLRSGWAPVAVAANGALKGVRLTAVSTSGSHVCALDGAADTFCWGGDFLGELGIGATGGLSQVPVAVVFPPTRVTAVVRATAATVSWAAPASLGGGTLTGYTATASPGAETCSTTRATTCTIPLPGLAQGNVYTITVTTHTTKGSSGPSTPPVTVQARTGPITGYGSHCMDDPGYADTDGTKIVLWACDGSPGENWTVTGDGTIQIHGKCLGTDQGHTTSKTPAVITTCTGTTSQQWHPSNGTLANQAAGMCLDDPGYKTANGTVLDIYPCSGGLNQRWKLPTS